MSLDGFYLSVYLSPPGRFAFTPARHDQCAALFQVSEGRVEVVRYWELERVTGYKHHNAFLYESEDDTTELLSGLMAEEGLALDDVVTIWGTPGIGAGRDLPIPNRVRTSLPIHSICHVYSGLYLHGPPGPDPVLCLALDGGPDYTLESEPPRGPKFAGAVVRGDDMQFFPVESPGPIWSIVERRTGVEPGTLMALASATTAAMRFDHARILRHSFFGTAKNRSTEKPEHMAFDDLMAAAEEAFRSGEIGPEEGFSEFELTLSAMGKVIIACSIEIVRRTIDRVLVEFGLDPGSTELSMTGGYALNCPTNSHLMDHYGFRRLRTPPCANDGGQALGLGLLALDGIGALHGREIVHHLPFAGSPLQTSDAAGSALAELTTDSAAFDAETFLHDLRSGPVAWISGCAEVGPRALGHRSLLVSPESIELKQRINDVKRRQWWRPVAPIVLEERAAEWFECSRPSPYMLETFEVKKSKRHLVPVIAHLDGSARVQTLNAHDDRLLYDAVSSFAAVTGIPIVGNTSLNDRGEPLVNTVEESLTFCRRKGITVIYVDGVRHRVRTGGTMPQEPAARPFGHLYARQAWDPAIFDDPDLDFALVFLIYRYPALRRFASWSAAAEQARRVLKLASERERAEIAEGADRIRAGITSHFDCRGAVSTSLIDLDAF